jgi:hypothetical protein
MAEEKEIRTAEGAKALKKRRPRDQGRLIQEYLSHSGSAEETLFKINELLFAGNYESTRKHVRAPVSVPVIFRVGEVSYNSSTYTLSQKGAFIKYAEPPLKGTRLNIELFLPDGEPRVQAEGEVVQSAALNDAMRRADISGMSVVFKKIKPEDRRRIDKLVRSQARKIKSRAR